MGSEMCIRDRSETGPSMDTLQTSSPVEASQLISKPSLDPATIEPSLREMAVQGDPRSRMKDEIVSTDIEAMHHPGEPEISCFRRSPD